MYVNITSRYVIMRISYYYDCYYLFYRLAHSRLLSYRGRGGRSRTPFRRVLAEVMTDGRRYA